MLLTPNLSLKKPEGTDNVNIDDFNANADTLDAVVAAKETPTGAQTKVNAHANLTNNPHGVTAAQTGAIPTSQKGTANGVASLDGGAKVPAAQLPAPSPRSATFVVAASNSSAAGKAAADYVCTGTNDQTTINNAITASGANGGKVVLLEGTFAIAAAINLASNVSIEGQGNGTVLRISNANNTTMNAINSSGVSFAGISDLSIDGNKANNSAGTQSGISLSSTSDTKIRSVYVANMRNYGIILTSASNYNAVTACTAVSCSYGIYASDGQYNSINGNSAHGNSSYGISLSGDNNSASGNTCQGNSNGIGVSGDSNSVTGNTCQGGNTNGINVDSTGKSNTITGNTCHGNRVGITVLGSNQPGYHTVSGNICRLNDENGIKVASSSNNIITGNVCVENSQSANNTYDNIMLTGNSSFKADNNNIQGNTCRQGALTNKPRYGINISSSFASGNLVTNNDLATGGATGAFNDAGTGTVTTAGNKLT